MDIDLGSLADAIADRGAKSLGEDVWERHKETISGFWDSLVRYFEVLDVSGFKLYQDGMIANSDIALKIVEDGVRSGSKNYEIIERLIKRGAVLIKTEDFSLVLRERNSLKQLTSKVKKERLIAYLRYKLTKNNLLKKRDKFIAQRINDTLNKGGVGILFIGAYHDIIPMLNEDIQVKEIKEIKKIRDYQKALLKKDMEVLSALSKYLILPVEIKQ